MKVVIKVMVSVFVFCTLLLGGGVVVLHYFILPSDMLKDQLLKVINRETNIVFDCEEIALNYTDNWPFVSLALNKVVATIPSEDGSQNVLETKFEHVSGKLQLLRLLRDKEISLDNIRIMNAEINVENSKPLPPILKKTREQNAHESFFAEVESINLTGINIQIEDSIRGMEIELNDILLDASFIYQDEQPIVNIHTLTSKIGFENRQTPFQLSVNLSLKGKCKASEDFDVLEVQDVQFYINQFPFELDGTVRGMTTDLEPKLDLRWALLASDLRELQDFLPIELLKDKNEYIVSGTTALTGEIKGTVVQGTMPSVKVDGYVKDGSIYRKGIAQGIDTISLNLKMRYDEQESDSCYLDIRNAMIRGLNSDVLFDGHLANLQATPFVTGDITGNIDFTRIGTEFVPAEMMTLQGKVNSNLSFAFNMQDAMEMNLNKLWLDGALQTDFMQIQSAQYNIDTYISNLYMTLGYKKNRSNFISRDEVFSGNIDIDSMKVVYGNDIDLNLSKMHVRTNTMFVQDSASRPPLTVHLECADFSAKMETQKWMAAKKLETHFGTKTSGLFRKSSDVALVVRADEIKYLDLTSENALILGKTDFMLEAMPKSEHCNFYSAKDWNIKGVLNADNSKGYYSVFPEMIIASNIRMGFQNNLLVVNNLQAKVGESDMLLSGTINTKRESLTQKSSFDGSLRLVSQSLNVNELKQIYLYGEALQKSETPIGISSITMDDMEKLQKKRGADVAIEAHPVYIPENVRLDITMDVNELSIYEMYMQDVKGSINVKNKKATSVIAARTNMGRADVEVLYDATDEQQIKALSDINLKSVLVGHIGQVIPTVSVMFPMVDSMDGLVDCRLTLETALDNNMMPVLSSIRAACSLRGQNLGLNEDEKIKEITKRFFFKDKEHLEITDIQADLMMQDGNIEIIPFWLTLDRYAAIIGGRHTVNGSFQKLAFAYDYHIDVLKSPIPLVKVGLDMKGSDSNLKYNLTSRKFKDWYVEGQYVYETSAKNRFHLFRDSIIEKLP